MAKGKQTKQEQAKQVEVVDKKIKKAEEQLMMNQLINLHPLLNLLLKKEKSKHKIKNQRPQKTDSVLHYSSLDKLYYPEAPSSQFPDQLQQNVINVIASFGASAALKEITNNLSLFYTNAVEEQTVHNFLAQAEESGIIYERSGQYHVAQELIPPEPQPKQEVVAVPQTIEQEPLPQQVIESAVKQPLDNDQIDFEDQIQHQASEKKEVINDNPDHQDLFDN
ncbi:unnamed protein product (macronuclear) [Paramecium tetraurelia]|uniref:H15 domain-containing protein n=1 Tax=Paramecium tetraurelia TaxID=5888 RepID=A0C3Y1_PARTE|nr:uncharacterized protein GSPATT00034977001 [Paramecium tetraurelia]CAK65498.1 unnamed protein product [Paramecium tetraurelia]|eukprot:XP_001432895.1 hypothetical protein (macronuclear) [Paramecium tetraurelia strain d4-2]